MAFQKIFIDPAKQYGQRLLGGLTQFENGLKTISDIRDTMTLMIDGDGSNESMFNEVTLRFGTISNTASKAAWDELNSCLAKQFTDGSITFVNAAREQLFDKLR